MPVNVASAVTNRRLKEREEEDKKCSDLSVGYLSLLAVSFCIWKHKRGKGENNDTTTSIGPICVRAYSRTERQTFFGSSGTVHCGPPLALCFRSRFIGPLNWVCCLPGVFTNFKREKLSRLHPRKRFVFLTMAEDFFFWRLMNGLSLLAAAGREKRRSTPHSSDDELVKRKRKNFQPGERIPTIFIQVYISHRPVLPLE